MALGILRAVELERGTYGLLGECGEKESKEAVSKVSAKAATLLRRYGQIARRYSFTS